MLIELSHLMTKPTKWHVRPVKTQISLGICPVWSESSQCAQWVAKDPMFLYADSEDSDQTGRMPGWSESSLGAHAILLVLSWGGSSDCFWLKNKTCRMVLMHKWAAAWQNQQNGMWAQRRLRSVWVSTQSDQSLLSAWRKLGWLATHWALSEGWSD